MSTAPNMATITESLERSLQNCSLNHHRSGSTGSAAAGCPDSPPSPTLELNSQAALPFHWEQCLDLKTGEVYYINWRTGAKAREDPRASPEYYSDDDEEDESSYDSDGGSSPESSSECSGDDQERCPHRENTEPNNTGTGNVLVVAGCKSCLMYYMVPKQVEICPKCCGQLLHFDRSIDPGSSC